MEYRQRLRIELEDHIANGLVVASKLASDSRARSPRADASRYGSDPTQAHQTNRVLLGSDAVRLRLGTDKDGCSHTLYDTILLITFGVNALENYCPAERVLLSVFPVAMRCAGPREALFHTLCRKNYSCTHFIVGCDRVGVGDYYGSSDDERIFADFRPDELGITPLFFDHTYYCLRCGVIASIKTCPHTGADRTVFSGTEVRRRLEAGQPLPPKFTRPEVAKVLMDGSRRGGKQCGSRRMLVIGLYCAEPTLIFNRWPGQFPNLRRLMTAGTYGQMESCVPCITVPAWAVMMSSKDPGQLGIDGFHNRAAYSYDAMTVANSAAIHEPMLWDILSQRGKQVVVIEGPPTYPSRPVTDVMVGCFLTPSTEADYTYPSTVSTEIQQCVGDYMVVVSGFRTEDKERLLHEIYDMTHKRFEVVKHFIQSQPWDFCMFVEIGMDRIQHTMWKYHDTLHPGYVPGNRYETAILDYYKYVDVRLGQVLDLLDDDTVILIISDHGAKTMIGVVNINEWLIHEGYLVVKSRPTGPVQLRQCEIDWAQTRAWGREPNGAISPVHYNAVHNELAEQLTVLKGLAGTIAGTQVYKPEEIYRACRCIPPDLMVYFGNLSWRLLRLITVRAAVSTTILVPTKQTVCRPGCSFSTTLNVQGRGGYRV